MKIVEYRVPLPLDVKEYNIAQLFVVMHFSHKETESGPAGEGVEILVNEPYDNLDNKMGKSKISGITIPNTKGQYTLKHYHFASRIPAFLSAICPRDSMVLVEEAWNAYPHCLTILTSAYLSKDKFFISVESVHVDDVHITDQENRFGLTDKELNMNIADKGDSGDKALSNLPYDPKTFVSKATGRGPLGENWHENTTPTMTCIKLIKTKCDYWGLQGKVEGLITKQQRKILWESLSNAFFLIDEWKPLTLEDIRELEEKAKTELNEKRTSSLTT